MRVLSFDPGATRMGYAIIESGPKYIGSGVLGVERGKTSFQNYRLKVIRFWSEEGHRLLQSFYPDHLVSEIVPAVGGKNFSKATQSQLAVAAITAVHTLGYLGGYGVSQIASNTIKSRIGGHKDATKVKVRNGVIQLLPNLEHRLKEWRASGIFDETDAIATGLAFLGYRSDNK